MNLRGDPLVRSRRAIAAARLLSSSGFVGEAISRAYFAAFYAAEAALAALGQSRSKHSAVLSAVNQFLVRPGEISAEAGNLLRPLFELRNDADYGPADAPAERAITAIANAERFIAAVEAWLANRERA